MSGYYNPLDSLVAPTNTQPKTLYGVVKEGTNTAIAYFMEREDAEYFANEGYFYPYKGFPYAEVREFDFAHFNPQQRIPQ